MQHNECHLNRPPRPPARQTGRTSPARTRIPRRCGMASRSKWNNRRICIAQQARGAENRSNISDYE